MAEFPKTVNGLDLTSVDDGLVVNDHRGGKVHYLNHTAGLVLTLCNGKNSIQTIATLLQRQFELAHSPEEEVKEIIREFLGEELIELEIG